MIFKTMPILENSFYAAWHDTLIDLIVWIISLKMVDELIVTSAYRPGDKGVHGTDPLRGLDIRGKGKKAQKVVDKINDHWQYDSRRPEKKVAMLHNVGRGEHIHLQVHDSTCIFRGNFGSAKQCYKDPLNIPIS